MESLHFGKKLRRLVPSQFESSLLGAALYTKKAGGWTAAARSQGVLLNLSRVEWVDLGAVVQLVLLAESALRNRIPVTVALPLARPTSSEERWLTHTSIPGSAKYIKQQIERRAAAKNFLDYLQFERALRTDHLGSALDQLRIIDVYEGDCESAQDDEEALRQQAPTRHVKHSNHTSHKEYLYKYFFPLTWLSGYDRQSVRKIANFIASVVGDPYRGLAGIDADAVANVILYELIDNVTKHADDTTWALISAWARPESLSPNPDDSIDRERPYLDWFSQTQVPMVEVVLGDSGRGIPASLTGSFRTARAEGKTVPNDAPTENANVMLWAFDRWSSSDQAASRRGTRGLYRIDRVVRKYQGLISVRSENQLVGRDHGGASYDEPISRGQKLGYIPGTVLRLRMPALQEHLPVWRDAGKVQAATRFSTVRLNPVGREGMNTEDIIRLQNELSSTQDSQPLCVLAVIGGGVGDRDSVETALRQAAELRHPAALMLCGLPGGWEQIENAVDSVNQEHEHRRYDRESYSTDHIEVWDPVLVVGDRGETAWVGARKSQCDLLSALLHSPNGRLTVAEIEPLVPDDLERASVLRALRHDTHLVATTPDQRIEMRFSLSEVVSHVCQTIQTELSRPSTRYETAKVFRSPSLVLIQNCLNIEDIVEASCGLDLAMLALAIRLKQYDSRQATQPPDVVFGDATVSDIALHRLQVHLGAKKYLKNPGETEAPIPRGVPFIAAGSRVVVHCGLILSGDTARRCLTQVLRDGASPTAVTCVIDARRNPEDGLKMWGTEIHVVKLVTADMIVNTGNSPNRVIDINPITGQREHSYGFEEEDDRHDQIKRDELAVLINKNRALHFSHIGRQVGRHFTFYLDASRLVEESKIAQAFNSAIDEWVRTRSSRQFELWHPAPEPKPPAPARRFAEWIFRNRTDVVRMRPIRREVAFGEWAFSSGVETGLGSQNVVIIDWGAISGISIMQMIRMAAEAGANGILVCVFLSQLSPSEEAFLTKLHTLHVLRTDNEPASDVQPDLPGVDRFPNCQGRAAPATKEHLVSVRLKFLSRIALRAYQLYDCPVCEERRRLGQDAYPTALLDQFVRSRDELLRHRKRDEVLNAEPVDFSGTPLDDNAPMWMIRFRETLERALRSTYWRHQVHGEIEAMSNRVCSGHPVPREAHWLLHLLSVESQWLHRPPLHLEMLRGRIAEMSYRIATNKDIPEPERLNASIVLRTSSKAFFSEQLPQLFFSYVGADGLMQRVLYDIHTYLSRPYHQSVVMLKPIRDGLQAMQHEVKEGRIAVSAAVAETLDVLSYRAESKHARAAAQPLTAAKAWSQLRGEFGDQYQKAHNTVTVNMILVLPGPDAQIIDELATEEPTVDGCRRPLDSELLPWLRGLKHNWQPCQAFLDKIVLPLLGRLTHILKSDEGRRALGPDARARLVELLDSGNDLAQSPFSTLLRRVADHPEAILEPRNWQLFRSEVTWLWNTLLRPREANGSASAVIEFLRTAPTDLGTTFRAVYDEVNRKLGNHSIKGLDEAVRDDVSVFCTQGVLRDTFRELLTNCHTHRQTEIDGPVLIWLEVDKVEEEIRMTLRNTLTTPDRMSHGVGLSLLRDRLRPFRARMEPPARPVDPSITYEVTIYFQPGED